MKLCEQNTQTVYHDFRSLTKLVSQFLDIYTNLSWIYNFTLETKLENPFRKRQGWWQQFGLAAHSKRGAHSSLPSSGPRRGSPCTCPHFSKIAPGMTGYYAVPLRTIALEKLYAVSTPTNLSSHWASPRCLRAWWRGSGRHRPALPAHREPHQRTHWADEHRGASTGP